jgi:hypothetical protein
MLPVINADIPFLQLARKILWGGACFLSGTFPRHAGLRQDMSTLRMGFFPYLPPRVLAITPQGRENRDAVQKNPAFPRLQRVPNR